MPLNDRQSSILLAILREYIKTARAVGSKTVVGKYRLGLSPASVRNAMVELEDRGYLAQPHTSAGRMPTAKAYRFFVDTYHEQGSISNHKQTLLRQALRESAGSAEERLKNVAKAIATIASNTVIIGFAPNDIYYTGLSNLFHQPEFSHLESVRNFSEVVDHLDDVVAEIYDGVSDEPTVFIGAGNPFGEDTGALMTKCLLKGNSREKLMGILGPLRMPYDEHMALLRYTSLLLRS